MMRWLQGWLLMVLLAALASAPARAEWLEAKSNHFIIYSEQSPDDLRAYATRLERFDLAVRKARGKDDPPLTDSNRLTVYVLANQPAVESLSGVTGVAGFYIPRVAGSVAFVHRGRKSRDKWDLNAETVFFHEYMHHLMLQDIRIALPHWMVEGYAEFFATAEILDDGSVRIGAVPAYRARSLFNLGNYAMSLTDMLQADYKNADRLEVVSVYGTGWLLTHYLTFEPGRRGQATRYAQAIQNGTPPLEAAKAAFGDLNKLEREIERYLYRKTMTTITIPASDLKVGPIAIRPLTPGEEAIMKVRMRSDRGVTKKTAGAVAADARRVASRFPNDAAVQSALAEAEHDAKNYEASIAAAERALAADPRSMKALIYKGRSLLEMGKRHVAKTDWNHVRSWFAKANRLDPEDPEPLMLYYQTYRAEGAYPPKIAAEGLYYAHVLVPQDEEVRLAAFRQYILDKKLVDAKNIFATMAYNPHAEAKRRKKLMAIMEAISAGNSTQALSLLDALEEEDRKKRDG